MASLSTLSKLLIFSTMSIFLTMIILSRLLSRSPSLLDVFRSLGGACLGLCVFFKSVTYRPTLSNFILDSFMSWLFVHLQRAFECCFVITFIAIKFYIPMFWLFMNLKNMLARCFVVTLVTAIIDTLMISLFVQSQINFFCCFVLSLITIILNSLMFRLLVHL